MTERTFTAEKKMALKDVAAVLLASLGGNGEYLNDLEKSCVRRAATELTAAHERETELRGENDIRRREHLDACRLIDGLRESLAEAQREIVRLTTESSSLSDAYDTALSQRDEAVDTLTAERQKVTALRDYATCRQDEAQRKSYVVYESSYEQGLQTAYGNVIDEMDALGLTPAQPPQDAEPAT